jgi:hypothetical protein
MHAWDGGERGVRAPGPRTGAGRGRTRGALPVAGRRRSMPNARVAGCWFVAGMANFKCGLHVQPWPTRTRSRSRPRPHPSLPFPTVVVVLSREFVCKKWPMQELEAALARPLLDAAAAAGPGGGGGEPVTLLPVLIGGLTVEDLGNARTRLYSADSWPTGFERPAPDVLDKWAALLKRVSTIVCKREDQARGSPPGNGVLFSATVGACKPRRIAAGWERPVRLRNACRGTTPRRVLLRGQRIAGARAALRLQAQHFRGRLAKEVAPLCVAALKSFGHLRPVALAEPDQLFGIEEQEARLLAELVVPEPRVLGLWLHGMGEPGPTLKASCSIARAQVCMHPCVCGAGTTKLSYPITGGIGKTTMAKRLCNRLSQAFPKRAVISLDADDHDGKESQRHLASALKQLGAKDDASSASAAELLTRLARLVAQEPVLLVVDNVWTSDQLDNLLPRSFHPGSRLIVTSRFAELGSSGCYRVSCGGRGSGHCVA